MVEGALIPRCHRNTHPALDQVINVVLAFNVEGASLTEDVILTDVLKLVLEHACALLLNVLLECFLLLVEFDTGLKLVPGMLICLGQRSLHFLIEQAVLAEGIVFFFGLEKQVAIDDVSVGVRIVIPHDGSHDEKHYLHCQKWHMEVRVDGTLFVVHELFQVDKVHQLEEDDYGHLQLNDVLQ